MRSSLSLLRSSLFGFSRILSPAFCPAQLVGEKEYGAAESDVPRALLGTADIFAPIFGAREQLADREEVLVILLAVYRKRRYVTVLAAVSRCVDFHSLAVFEMYPGFLEERRTEGVFSGAGATG